MGPHAGMSTLTITVLDGADRGRVYRDLKTPITIGREEGNSIQLNDERVSRCHLKIQRDGERMVLTDLDSTNGTRVNGQECQLKILRLGDFVGLGRSTIFIGSETDYAERMAQLEGSAQDRTVSRDDRSSREDGGEGVGEGPSSHDFELNQRPVEPKATLIGAMDPPQIPDDLTPVQAAQLCEILEYYHRGFQQLIDTAAVDDRKGEVSLPRVGWQRLLQAQARLATMIRHVADPEWPQ